MRKSKLFSIVVLLLFTSMNSWAQFYAPPGGTDPGSGGSVSVSLNKDRLALIVGECETLTCSISGGMGILFPTWTVTEGEDCVAIFEEGDACTVTAQKAGSATITASYSGQSATCTVTVSNRTVTANEGATGEYWATYYNATEFGFTADENTTVFQAALAGTQLTMTEVANREIPASKAVILKSSAATITLTLASTTATLDGNQLQGTATAITNPGNAYVLNKGAKGVGFYKLSADGTIGANKAYLTYSATARDFFGFGEGEITGVNEELRIKNEESATDPTWYNLNGQRVAQPAKGLYIVNGKKVVIK